MCGNIAQTTSTKSNQTNTGTGNSDIVECWPGSGQDTVLRSSLHDASFDVNLKSSTQMCYCAKPYSTTKSISSRVVLATPITGIKTLIFTAIPENNGTNLPVVYQEVSNSSPNLTLCAGGCNLGTNNFTVDVIIARLHWTTKPGQFVAICEIWAYQYYNWIPGSVITACIPGQNSKSVNFASYSTNNNFFVLKDQTDTYFTTGGKHTCIHKASTDSEQLAYIVVDFPYPLIIHEILQKSGSYNTNIYLIDPDSPLMLQNACQLVTTAKALTDKDLVNYVDDTLHTTVQLISSNNHVISIPCSATGCSTFGATRMIFASQSPPPPTITGGYDFFTCGMAVMAEISPCTSQCIDPILEKLAICPANLTLNQGETKTSDSFLFPTSVINPCGNSLCDQTSTHTLSCIDCNTCNDPVACSGSGCQSTRTTPTFQYSISQDILTKQSTITVIDDQNQVINHYCTINSIMTSSKNTFQTNDSSCSILIKANVCPSPSVTQCSQTKLEVLNLSSCPSDITVPLNQTLTTSAFRFPDSFSTQCVALDTSSQPYVCDVTQVHTLNCQTCTSSMTSCGANTTSPPIIYDEFFDLTTKKYQFRITGNSSGVYQKCKIIAKMDFGQVKESLCSFNIKLLCPNCSSLIFTESSIPQFDNPIAIGATGQTKPFTAFKDTVTTCGNICSNQMYTVYCLDNSDPSAQFQTLSSILSGAISNSVSTTYPNYTLKIQTEKISLNGQSYTCMLNVINLATGCTATMNSTENFIISFSLCSNKSESCPLDTWLNSAIWTKPTSISVYLDGVTKSAQIIYTNITDSFSQICGAGYCGTLEYKFLDNSTLLPISIPGATVIVTDDSSTNTLSISCSTLDTISVGVTKVRVYAFLNQGTIWSGPVLSYNWTYFNITVVNPCSTASPCVYTNLINPGTTMITITIYLDGEPVSQNQEPFNDTVSKLCYNNEQQCAKTYKLVYSLNGTEVNSQLAYLAISASTIKITAQTYDVAYVGTWNVQVKCTTSATFALGNAFDLIVEACSQKSCKYTTLIQQISPPDKLPASFTIGVDNVAGYTTISTPLDTVGNACSSNHQICGIPTLQLLYVSNNTSLSFASIVIGSPNIQSAVTNNINLKGVHNVYIQQVLDLKIINSSWPTLVQNSDNYSITVDYCTPLPCNYNYIYYPYGVNPKMPSSVSVITNGVAVTDSFTEFSDQVSLRCSPESSYTNKCGLKKYIIEKEDGTALPFSVIPVYNSATSLWDFSISTSNWLLADTYKAVIHAQFVNPTNLPGNQSDNMTYPFTIILEVPDPCIKLNCSRRALVMSRIGYLEPQNVTIDVSLNANFTLFDSFNDTKTQSCFGLPGSDINGVEIQSWLLPCCSPPLYQLVDADTGDDLNTFFGTLIQVNWYENAKFSQIFKVQVSTNDKSLVGDHIVKLAVRLLESDIPQYSQNFTITVVDPCNPPNCDSSIFKSSGPKPTDIEIKIGEGYKSSIQNAWVNSVDTQCQQKVCETLLFQLRLSDGQPVPFDYFYVESNGEIQVFVIITDESQKGQTIDVILHGYGLNQQTNTLFGTNGTSETFKVIVGSDVVVNQYQQSTLEKPIFSLWPKNQVFRISKDETEITSLELDAIAFSSVGIKQISVDLSSAFSFLSYEIQNDDTIQFKIEFDKNPPIGTFRISAIATDNNDQTVKSSFTITFVYLVNNELPIKQKFQKSIGDPLIATIESISNQGLMTISYNKKVMPITDVTWITKSEFYLIFQQSPDEVDQTDEFMYQVIKMTPDNIFVQLNFSRPLDVSQGTSPDRVQLFMLRNVFMVEDVSGVYKNWHKEDPLFNETVDINQIRRQENYKRFENLTVYTQLNKPVPKQLADSKSAQNLEQNIKVFGQALQIVMWLPLATHLIGFGQMEYTWVIFTNLQLISCLSQFDLKLPLNLVQLTQSFADISNSNFLPYTQLYQWYRKLGSESETPNLNLYGQTLKDSTGNITAYAKYVGVDDRMLTSDFEQSRFYGQGYTDRVFETAAQFFLSLLILFIIGICGIILEKSCLFCLPPQIEEAFYYLRSRIFWCFPLRMLVQQYMCITFSALINLKYKNTQDTVENQVNRALSICTLIFYSIGFILFIFIFLYRFRNHLIENQEFFRKFGTLILSLEIEKKYAIPQVGLGLLRKFLLIAITINMPFNILQICASLYVQEIYTVYILIIKPFEFTQRDAVEYFNEITLLVLIILMTPLTDYVTDTNIRFQVGWVIIYIVYCQLTLNVLFLMFDMQKSFYKIYKLLRYKLHMYRLRNQQLRHNQTVNELDRYKMTIGIDEYKKKNPLLKKQLSVIESEGSYQSKTEIVDLEKSKKQNRKKTVQERQQEFKQLMKRLEIENANKPKFVVPVPLDYDGTPMVDFNLQQKLQANNDWPVTPRQTNQIQIEPNIAHNNSDFWGWIDQSKVSDWYALPKDYIDQSRQFAEMSVQIDSEILPDSQNSYTMKFAEEVSVDPHIKSKVNVSNDLSLEPQVKPQKDSEDSLLFSFN